MSLIYYASQEETIKESINKYKDIFDPYIIKPPTLKEALEQMFLSTKLTSEQVNLLTNSALEKINQFMTKERFQEIKNKYPKITIEDAKIITSYTYELPEKVYEDYNIYKLLNKNMVEKNRRQGINNISKYLFLLLNTLRQLTGSHYDQLYRCISALVKLDYDSFDKNYIPYLKGKEKTFWGFTSTSQDINTCKNFLSEEGNKGTIFSLIGDIWGYDITLFNICGENEILLEPEIKFIVQESLPAFNGIIYVRCLIQKTATVLENIFYTKEKFWNNSNIIFDYISDKTKLNIVKYNKRLQNVINLNIMNYRIFSGKYIIFETKTKGKEYNAYNDNIIFEGGYLNGKRNGEGKEFDENGQLIFEGKYYDGKRNGEGKEYLIYIFDNKSKFHYKEYKNVLKFKGEYLIGERNGKGKEYNIDGNIIFEGEYLGGERNGQGKEYNYEGELIFEGEYLDGKRWNGKGKEYNFKELIFEGDYLDGKRWNGKEKNIIMKVN